MSACTALSARPGSAPVGSSRCRRVSRRRARSRSSMSPSAARRRLACRRLEEPPGALPERALGAVQALIRDLRAAPRVSLAALQVVVREIRRLAEEGGD